MIKNFPLILLILILGLCFKPLFVLSETNENTEINFFYSKICPYCAEEEVFLDELEIKYPSIIINRYEILYSPDNREILEGFYERYQVSKKDMGYVPITFTSKEYFIGFNEQNAIGIESCLRECIGQEGLDISNVVNIPFFGDVDISNMSLFGLTIVLGGLDGLNPCAMWVLMFLLALLINTHSRKKMLLIGGVFILASGVIYFLILSAWLNLFLVMGYANITRIIIGILALSAGIWQVKNFLTYHPGVCKVLGISSRIESRLKLKEKAEKIVSSPIALGTIGGLIILAFAVNLVEFFCSAGLPAIYTRVLSSNSIVGFRYYLYLILYTIIFMLDDIIIFSLAIFTLRKIGFTEKYNYWATLIGGLLIFILGALLIFRPELLMFM